MFGIPILARHLEKRTFQDLATLKDMAGRDQPMSILEKSWDNLASFSIQFGTMSATLRRSTFYGESIETLRNMVSVALQLVEQEKALPGEAVPSISRFFAHDLSHKVSSQDVVLVAEHPTNPKIRTTMTALRHRTGLVSMNVILRKPWQHSVSALPPGVIEGLQEYTRRNQVPRE